MSITDVPGLKVGHWTDLEAGTGCTVVLCGDEGVLAGVDVRGAAPATRETDLLRPGSLVGRANAILLSGGSAFGLDAASGVMRYLEERGVGFAAPHGPVPIVPAAALYDLFVGRSDVRPDADAGYAACLAASTTVAEGTVGAGTGATVAKLRGSQGAIKGGIGTASTALPGGVVVAALVAVNAVGAIYDLSGMAIATPRLVQSVAPTLLGNTTLGVVATNASLDAAGVTRLASVAHDGLALTIRPAHTVYDGDTLFALSLPGTTADSIDPLRLGRAVVEVVAAAVVRGVLAATPLHGVPAAG